MKLIILFSLALFLGSVSAQATAALWAQCGGSTFNGKVLICPAPQVCTYLNDFFSQCLSPAVTSSSSAVPVPSTPLSTLKTTTRDTSSPTTTSTNTTTSTITSTQAAATPTVTWVPLWAQCGGQNSYQWANVQCTPPAICVMENQFFSNCFPPGYTSGGVAVPAAI